MFALLQPTTVSYSDPTNAALRRRLLAVEPHRSALWISCLEHDDKKGYTIFLSRNPHYRSDQHDTGCSNCPKGSGADARNPPPCCNGAKLVGLPRVMNALACKCLQYHCNIFVVVASNA